MQEMREEGKKKRKKEKERDEGRKERSKGRRKDWRPYCDNLFVDWSLFRILMYFSMVQIYFVHEVLNALMEYFLLTSYKSSLYVNKEDILH